MKLLLPVCVLLAVSVLLLSVRIMFGREKKFLRGHACGGIRQKENDEEITEEITLTET